jgi:methyl-accepting chemotaxis protein
MSEYHTLLGASEVATAGRQMLNAASEMNSAASTISSALDRHRQFMEEFIYRFEQAVEKISELPKDG